MLEKFVDDIYCCSRARCGCGVVECPVYNQLGFESYACKGRNLLLRHVIEGKLGLSEDLAQRFFKCTTCGYCTEKCAIDNTAIIKAFREELVERSLVPPEVRDFLENTHKYGNPWKEAKEKRGEWTEGTKIRQYESDDDLLYYIGCVGSYDLRGNEVAKALGEVLTESGRSLGVLGSRENCDGNEVNMLGEKGLFQLMAEKNIQQFKKLGVKKIVTLSPHAYNVMKNEYPLYRGNFEVKHYTQVVRDLIKSGKLNISRKLKARVTYHDPCFLGRYNGVYDAPREILKSIPGIELLEMDRTRQNSFCCGGGSGNFYTDFLGSGENSPSRVRIREAFNTGAEILAVACPTCMLLLDDAVKVEGLEEKLAIRDISEILNSTMKDQL